MANLIYTATEPERITVLVEDLKELAGMAARVAIPLVKFNADHLIMCKGVIEVQTEALANIASSLNGLIDHNKSKP